MIPLADVSVYGPSQKAIVAWNGVEEILILSTDVYADEKSTILEVLPLPSQPDLINKTDFSPFINVEELMSQHRVLGGGTRGGKDAGGTGVEILFHEKIGAHDITVIRVDDSTEFEDWANQFLKGSGVDKEVSSAKLAYFIDSYIDDGIPFFVLDLIEVSTEPRSIEPIIYRFKSPSLYFPLRISALASGEVDIAIFTISNGPIFEDEIPGILSLARYSGSLDSPVRFKVKEADLERIDPRIAELFGDDVWMTVLRYSGDLKGLNADLSISSTRTLLGDRLVGSPFFWLVAGVALGVTLGLVIAQMNLGVLGVEFKRLVSIVDFIILLLLLVLASVMAYTWAAYIFWILVPIATVTLYFVIRTGGKRILVIYFVIPLLMIAFVFSLLLCQTLVIALAMICLAGFMGAAAFPPSGARELSRALRRSSRWVGASTRKGRL